MAEHHDGITVRKPNAIAIDVIDINGHRFVRLVADGVDVTVWQCEYCGEEQRLSLYERACKGPPP